MLKFRVYITFMPKFTFRDFKKKTMKNIEGRLPLILWHNCLTNPPIFYVTISSWSYINARAGFTFSLKVNASKFTFWDFEEKEQTKSRTLKKG